MKLHLSGVKLPKLGSLKDRVYREYLVKETQLEAKKGEVLMLMALTNPSIDDPKRRREWGSTIRKIWTQYVSLLLNIEIPEKTDKEIEMMEFYQNVVKPSKPKLFRDKTGSLRVSGLDQLFN